tara:strand:- start:288 stop:713 length:426 start_codon:yes stop_codon:yes gene_type:complete
MADKVTELRLEAAFNRLLNGVPERTKPDGRISISRINQEAGLSQGAIYYYKDFVAQAKATIAQRKAQPQLHSQQEGSANSSSALHKLQDSLKKEKSLKKQYRNQRDDFKNISDITIKENVCLAFRILELEDENRRKLRSIL